MADFIKKQYPVLVEEKKKYCKDMKLTQKVNENSFEPSKLLIKNIATIANTLAQKGFIDSVGRLIYQSKPIEGSNIGDLLCIAMREDTTYKGVDEFVHLLSIAKIKPALVLNKIIRKKLIGTKISYKPTTMDHGVVFPNIMINDNAYKAVELDNDEADEPNNDGHVQTSIIEHESAPNLHKKRKTTKENIESKNKKQKRSYIHLRSPYSLRPVPKKAIDDGWIRTE